MGDYGGSYNHVSAAEVNYVVNEDYEDWSWMHNTVRTDDNAANAAEEGEYYHGDDGIKYEAEYWYSGESSQQVAREGATTSGYDPRRVRSASGGHTGVLLEDYQDRSSQGSEKNEHAKEKTRKHKTKKGVGRQFAHIQEPSLATYSDPGCGDDSYETPRHARNQSMDLGSSWLQDASLGEHQNDPFEAPQHAHAPPARDPPPHRHTPGGDMVARSASLPNRNAMGHYDHYETCAAGVQFNDTTPPYDPAAYGYPYYPEGQYEDNQLAVYDPSVSSAPGSIYRLEEKRMDKVFKFMKNGAAGFANVSKTAAVNLKQKSIEFKNLAIPVVKPILNAVIEESREQLMGPDRGRGCAYPLQRPNSAELDRMATPYVPVLGRGRAPMPRPMQRPSMMRPGMPLGQRPVMRPGMLAGQRPLMRPGMRPGMPRPQGAVPPMAVSAARGQGVAMRGQPRPQGRARPVGPTDPY